MVVIAGDYYSIFCSSPIPTALFVEMIKDVKLFCRSARPSEMHHFASTTEEVIFRHNVTDACGDLLPCCGQPGEEK
jgi:hypothetical protein